MSGSVVFAKHVGYFLILNARASADRLCRSALAVSLHDLQPLLILPLTTAGIRSYFVRYPKGPCVFLPTADLCSGASSDLP